MLINRINRFFINDSAVISASIDDDTTGEPLTISSANWQFLRPDGTPLIVSTLPENPPAGTVFVLSAATSGFSIWSTVQWTGQSWLLISGTSSTLNDTQNEATLIIPGTAINQIGLYKGRAQLTLEDSTTRSVLLSFEVTDPFEYEMPIEMPLNQYFTNQFITTVLTISDNQAYISGIDLGANLVVNGPGFPNVTVPNPSDTESISSSIQSGSSSFTTNTYEYVIGYRMAVGVDGNYVEGYAGLPQQISLDSSHQSSIIFSEAIDPALTRAIYRHILGNDNWDLVVVLDNTAQTWIDNGGSINSYPPAGWYGSTEIFVTLYVEQAGTYTINGIVNFTVKGPNSRTFPAQRSLINTIQVYDPSILNQPVNTVPARIIDHAWMKLEDLFDSELGGPWLSDNSIKSFNKEKLSRLLPDAIYLVNNEFQPITTFNETNWPEDHIPLAAQALMVEGIYHLIRSYVEQPLPSGGTLNWYDRRDYMSRWQAVLQKEEDKLMHLADKFKLQYTGFGSTSMIVGGYATPITRLSRFWRTRYPRYIGPWGF